MAISLMATAHENAIGPIGQCIDHEVGMDHAAALHANDAHVRRVLEPGSASQVRSGVRAPVAGVDDDGGFKSVFRHKPSAWTPLLFAQRRHRHGAQVIELEMPDKDCTLRASGLTCAATFAHRLVDPYPLLGL